MRARALAVCTLALLCVRAHADSTPAWLQVSTPHFTVITNADEKQGRHVAAQFERMQAVFSRRLPAVRSDPITVLAVKNKTDFQDLEPAEYLAKGMLDLSGLFLQSNDRCYILVRLDASGEHPYATIYHEYTHYITRNAHFPLWLNEGIAEFYENSDIDSHKIRVGQPNPIDLRLLRTQSLLPLPTLFTIDRNSPYYHDEQKGSIFYSESWALTRMLFIDDVRNKTALLTTYLKALSAGQNSLTAAVTAFGDLNKLQAALDSEITRGDYAFLTLPLDTPVDEASYNVTPLTSTDADAFRAVILVADGRIDDARKLLNSVLAANPNNALAHETEGMLHLREHDFEAARRSYTEAVALHSTSYLAWYYAAVLTLRSGNHDDPAIEPELEQSLKLNPDCAPANDALASCYAMHRKLDDALRLSLHAIALDPDNLNFRLNNASVHLERKEVPEALSALEAARPLAHTAFEIAELNSRLDQIHRHQQEQAGVAAAAAASATDPRPATGARLVDNNPDPHYPDSPPTGPQHTAKGILRDVHCTYPTILTFTVDGGTKPLALYTNHMYKIDYWVTFYPKGGLDPCKIEGMNAVVTYTDVQDPRVAGQIVSIQVNK